ncbi:MAG: hypothetical protein R3E31_21150 [Chloroflexota bacterium]
MANAKPLLCPQTMPLANAKPLLFPQTMPLASRQALALQTTPSAVAEHLLSTNCPLGGRRTLAFLQTTPSAVAKIPHFLDNPTNFDYTIACRYYFYGPFRSPINEKIICQLIVLLTTGDASRLAFMSKAIQTAADNANDNSYIDAALLTELVPITWP